MVLLEELLSYDFTKEFQREITLDYDDFQYWEFWKRNKNSSLILGFHPNNFPRYFQIDLFFEGSLLRSEIVPLIDKNGRIISPYDDEYLFKGTLRHYGIFFKDNSVQDVSFEGILNFMNSNLR